MSVSNPASSIPRWLLPHRHLCAWPGPTAASALVFYRDSRLSISGRPTRISSRPYATRKPRRSPAARRAAQDPTPYGHVAETGRDTYSVDGLLQNALSDWDHEAKQRAITPRLGVLYAASVKDGFFSKDLSFETVKRITMDIMKVAAERAPTPSALESISTEPALIFQVGHVISVIDPRLRAWVISATAKAGVYTPIVLAAARVLRATRDPPSQTPVFARIESWAMQHHDPRCMLIHAQVLGRRQQFEEALRLVQMVMRSMQPVYTPPRDPVSLALDARIEPPWETYRWLKEKKEERDGPVPVTSSRSSTSAADAAATTAAAVPDQSVDAVTEMAALIYQDPAALVRYAQVMFQQGRLDAYEEHMNQAAATGNMDACRKLANFYYLKSQRKVTPEEEEKKKKKTAGTEFVGETTHIKAANPQKSTSKEPQPKPEPIQTQIPNNDDRSSVISSVLFSFTSLFTPSDPREKYKQLAYEWYKLADHRGCTKSALIFAILSRQRGDREAGLESLALAQQDSQFLRLTRRMRESWEDRDYEPEIPAQVLDT